jgi:hypothetical protein
MSRINVVDRTAKQLVRRSPAAFLSLLSMSVDPSHIRFEDTAVNVPELRGDSVLIFTNRKHKAKSGVLFEVDLNATGRQRVKWGLKALGLTDTLGIPVPLCVIYLSKGRRANFPSSCVIGEGNLTNTYSFHIILLWEYRDRILSGELAELAPLLALCYARPSKRVLEQERQLILAMDCSEQEKADLLAMAAAVATRWFTHEELRDVFREEMQMLKEAGFIEEWLQEREEQGERRGLDKGRDEGRVDEARTLAIDLLAEWFGELMPTVIARIQQADEPYCRDLISRARKAPSLDALGLT